MNVQYTQLADLQYYLAPDVSAAIKKMDRPASRVWFEQNGGYLHPVEEGKLAVDIEAKTFGVPFDHIEFLERAIAALGASGEVIDRARRLLK